MSPRRADAGSFVDPRGTVHTSRRRGAMRGGGSAAGLAAVLGVAVRWAAVSSAWAPQPGRSPPAATSTLAAATGTRMTAP